MGLLSALFLFSAEGPFLRTGCFKKSSSREQLTPRCVCMPSPFSHVWLFVTPWAVAHQALLSMEFSRQEYWSGWLFPSPGDLPDPGIEPGSPALTGRFFTTVPPGKLDPTSAPLKTGTDGNSVCRGPFMEQAWEASRVGEEQVGAGFRWCQEAPLMEKAERQRWGKTCRRREEATR